MAEDAPSLRVIVTDEGFFYKSYLLSPEKRLKRLFNDYRQRLCATCTDASLLEFWYEATKLEDAHTPASLGLTDDDVIDVRIAHQHTRGACPVPAQQTLPNVHYLVDGDGDGKPAAVETKPPRRVHLTIKDQTGGSLNFTMKPHTAFRNVIEAFAKRAGREVWFCKFLFDGVPVLPESTPKMMEMEDGDVIDVFTAQTGGGGKVHMDVT